MTLTSLFFDLFWAVCFPVQYVPGAPGMLLRRLFWRPFLGGMGRGVKIDAGVQFVNPRHIFLGDDTWVDKYSVLIAGPPHEGHRNFSRRPNPRFTGCEGELRIGARCHIAPHSLIQAHGGVSIGDELTIASGARIYSMSHHYRPLDGPQERFYRFSSCAPERDQALIVSPVVIENGAAVGLNAIVLPGSTIGENTWVGAGSLVDGEVPPACVAVGIPLKIVRRIVLESPPPISRPQ